MIANVPLTRLLFLIAAAWWLTPSAEADPVAMARADTPLQRIEVVIDNSAFVLAKPVALRLGTPTAFILRNQDIVPHGLTAPAFPHMDVRVEGEGISAYGTGIRGVHIDPGKTLVLYFTPERGGAYTFRCDLHPQMKGELIALDLPAA